MELLKLKAKVLLISEEQMEVEDKYDLGNIAKSKEWVWRNVAIPVEEVYRIIEFNKSKTIVQMYDEERILVAESFEEVFNKWRDLKGILGEDIETQEEAEQGGSDENTE